MQRTIFIGLVGISIVSSGFFCDRKDQKGSIQVATQSLYQDASHLIPNQAREKACMDALTIDIDGDQDIDIVLAIEHQANVLLLNQGNQGFQEAASFSSRGRDSEDLVVVDFDQDNDLDIVSVSEDDRVNQIYQQIRQGVFTELENLIELETITNGVIAMQVDGRLGEDLILADQGENPLLLNTGGTGFRKDDAGRLPSLDITSQDLESGDVDGDGDLDIVVANEGQNQILINDGRGFFKDETEQRLPAISDESREVELADLDGDGDLDLIYANVNLSGKVSPQNRILINNGQGLFQDQTESRLPLDEWNSFDIEAVDLDEDGDLDLIWANGNLWVDSGRGFAAYENDGDGKFTAISAGLFPEIVEVDGFDIEYADLNGDGKKDLYLCSRGRKDGGRTDFLLLRKNGEAP